MRLLPLTSRSVEGAKTQVTMRLEGTHAACLGQSQGLLVVGCGLVEAREIVLHGDLAQEPQRLGLGAVPLAGAAIGQRLLGKVTGFGSTAKQEIGLANSGRWITNVSSARASSSSVRASVTRPDRA